MPRTWLPISVARVETRDMSVPTRAGDMPVRVYNKTGNGLGDCVDSGLFETDDAAWVVAAMATGQQDFAMRPGDAAPSAFAEIGQLLYERWGT